MPKITYIKPDGTPLTIENAEGNLMEIAVENGVDGITGDCGGVCSCSTCHVRITPEWIERVGPASADEKNLLSYEDSADGRSRLGCQVVLNPELDGLIVEVVGS